MHLSRAIAIQKGSWQRLHKPLFSSKSNLLSITTWGRDGFQEMGHLTLN